MISKMLAIGWMEENLHQLIGGSSLISGFQPSFWCRVSQPSAVGQQKQVTRRDASRDHQKRRKKIMGSEPLRSDGNQRTTPTLQSPGRVVVGHGQALLRRARAIMMNHVQPKLERGEWNIVICSDPLPYTRVEVEQRTIHFTLHKNSKYTYTHMNMYTCM